MEKLGYLLLISMYLISFTVGKTILNENQLVQSKVEYYSSQSVKSTNDFIGSIGLDNFFEELTKGL